MPGGCCPRTPTRWGCGRWWRSTWPPAGTGDPGDHQSPDRVTIGRARLTGLAADLAALAGDFYARRALHAQDDLPPGDVLVMQADGKGIALRPEHRAGTGTTDATHPGIKKMAEIVAVADVTPAVREPEDIAAPPARRKEHPGPTARDKWVAASITGDIPAMIGVAYDEADRRDPDRVRQRIFLALPGGARCQQASDAVPAA
jgi:hypothetical protein